MKLKELIESEEKLAKLTNAFSDLKDDIEYDHDGYFKNIERLRRLHVDHRNHLTNLVIWSQSSSGIIRGERGSGKTHLMILGYSELVVNIKQHKTLPIYINLKKITFDGKSKEAVYRILSIHFFRNIKSQLLRILMDSSANNWIDKMLSIFDTDKKRFLENIQDTIEQLTLIEAICSAGDTFLEGTEKGTLSTSQSYKEIQDLVTALNMQLTEKGAGIGGKIETKSYQEIMDKYDVNNNLESYLSLDFVKGELIKVLNNLKLERLVFYIDEWEKLYSVPNSQEYVANYIDKLNGNPVYFWISLVPYRGSLHSISIGRDVQNQIDLSKDLIYEISNEDRGLCIKYFKEFINKRLEFYLGDNEIDWRVFFRSQKIFEKLVIASMGNTSDFGSILWNSIDEFIKSFKSIGYQGRPFEYISAKHINSAVKSCGAFKISNVEGAIAELQLYEDIKEFCINNKLSHFTIQRNKETIEATNRKEFSELLYQRLLHLRSVDETDKKGNIDKVYYIFAIDYSATYKLHNEDKKLVFCLESEVIHNKVRGIQYDIIKFYESFDFSQGKVIKCPHVECGKSINLETFKALIENHKICPFCSKSIQSVN